MSRARSDIENGREFSLYVLVSVLANLCKKLNRINTNHESLYHPVGYVITNVVDCSAAISPIASSCTIFLQALGLSIEDLMRASSSRVNL